MRIYRKKRTKSNALLERHTTWQRGLNTLVSDTQIKNDELAEAIDIQLVEDGKIQCPREGQAYYGASDGDRVTGIYPYYKSDGTKKLLRTSATKLQVYNGGSWDDVSCYTYTTTLNTEGVMAYDRLYLVNGTDPLTYYNGTDITSFTAISAPNAPTVTRTGTTGTYTYSYKITAVTAVGETTPSTADTEVANVAELDTSTYMTIAWSAVTNAIGYNIYGRKDGKWYFLNYLEGNGSVSYVDKGQDTPNELVIPPTENSTGGPTGVDIELYKDSLFIIGDPDNPSRLYYSAGGDKINDFSAANGGGFIDISKNDGQLGKALKVFKNSMVVFKEESIYQFTFSTSGAPSVQLITGAVGAISTRGVIIVENDLLFAGRRGIFSLGNVQGFAFDVLRTNELTARVRSIYEGIDPAYINKISAVYATKSNKNLAIFAYTPSGSTTNSRAIVFDVERGGFYEWTNITANCWTQYIDSTGEVYVLYGDDSSGYVKEILTGDDDFDSAIQGTFKLKSENFKSLSNYKNLKDISIVLRNPTGSVNMSLIVDGTTTEFSSNINTVSPIINFGHYLWSRFMFGSSYGSGAITTADDLVLRKKKNINLLGKTFQCSFTNGSSGASFTLLEVKFLARPRSERYVQSSDLI